MKNLLKKIEESWNVIFLEFDSNINKEIINDDLKFKLTKIENSWKNKIRQIKNQQNFSLQFFKLKEIKENDIVKIFNYHSQKIQNQPFKMYREINNFLNINYEIIKKINSFSWKNMECSKDFFQILFNFSNFMKNKNFCEIWYFKIIFKELYSLLDKYNIFFSISCSKVNSNDKHFELFNNKILDKAINKYNYIITESYDSINKVISFRIINNNDLEKLDKDKIWNKILIDRNRLEHSFLDSVLKKINLEYDVVLNELKNSVYYLIGMNIWLLTNLDQKFKQFYSIIL